jgi:type III pantothenate kinase
MLLAIDIGNTHAVLALFHKARIITRQRTTTSSFTTEKKCREILASVLTKHSLKVSGVVISSVVPPQTKLFVHSLQKYFHLKPLIINGADDIGIKIHYDNPSSVGADRLCNAVAAYRIYGGPAIVVDFGTATTFDVVSKKGEFLGGVIAPGLGTAATALHWKTAQLPPIQLKFPKYLVATSTTEAIQAGIMFGAVEAMEGIIRKIKRQLGSQTKVIATGGLAKVIAPRSTLIHSIEPDLVLYGARLIYEYTLSKKKRG